jgi:hypothetical protein
MHTHCGSHYSIRAPYTEVLAPQTPGQAECACGGGGALATVYWLEA